MGKGDFNHQKAKAQFSQSKGKKHFISYPQKKAYQKKSSGGSGPYTWYEPIKVEPQAFVEADYQSLEMKVQTFSSNMDVKPISAFIPVEEAKPSFSQISEIEADMVASQHQQYKDVKVVTVSEPSTAEMDAYHTKMKIYSAMADLKKFVPMPVESTPLTAAEKKAMDAILDEANSQVENVQSIKKEEKPAEPQAQQALCSAFTWLKDAVEACIAEGLYADAQVALEALNMLRIKIPHQLGDVLNIAGVHGLTEHEANLVREGKKIDAIKAYRDRILLKTGVLPGLKEAKDRIEAYAATLPGHLKSSSNWP